MEKSLPKKRRTPGPKRKPGPKPKPLNQIFTRKTFTLPPEIEAFRQTLDEPNKFFVDAVRETPECRKFLRGFKPKP